MGQNPPSGGQCLCDQPSVSTPMTDRSSTASAASTRRSTAAAARWNGKTIEISGRDGVLVCVPTDQCDNDKNDNTNNMSLFQVRTESWKDDQKNNQLVIQRVQGPWIAFRVERNHHYYYLTQHLYGQQARTSVIRALGQCGAVSSILSPELICRIVDYVVDQDTDVCYQPMTLEPPSLTTKRPTLLQQFVLVENYEQRRNNSSGNFFEHEQQCGIRSRFGKYWRSQHSNNTVSQSSHSHLPEEEWKVTELFEDNAAAVY